MMVVVGWCLSSEKKKRTLGRGGVKPDVREHRISCDGKSKFLGNHSLVAQQYIYSPTPAVANAQATKTPHHTTMIDSYALHTLPGMKFVFYCFCSQCDWLFAQEVHGDWGCATRE